MIRAGFVLNDRGNSWLGGIIYLQNLLGALRDQPDPRVSPVLFVPPAMPPSTLDRFAGVELVETALVEDGNTLARLGKLGRLVLGRDLALERLLRRHRVDVLSHGAPLGRSSSVASIAWIPDFQHVRLPELFTPDMRATRDRAFARLARDADAVILSSDDAFGDFTRFAPDAAERGRVLHFVSGMASADESTPLADLEARFGFTGPFFALPNQFWPHKNHALVVEALALLARRGERPLVLCTGNPANDRDPDYVPALVRRAAEAGVAASFRLLGMVSHADLSGLMRHAAAIINPSRFEGWSTSVEEAKSIGKTVLLSDLPVHREQAPARAWYFGTDDAAALANAMSESLARWSAVDDAIAAAETQERLPVRRAAFAKAYADLVQGVLNQRPRRGR